MVLDHPTLLVSHLTADRADRRGVLREAEEVDSGLRDAVIVLRILLPTAHAPPLPCSRSSPRTR